VVVVCELGSRKKREKREMTRPFTILVVDDSPRIREMFVDWFSTAKKMKIVDIEIMEAINGVDALEKIAVKMPNLVITDIMMPLMNGYQLIEKLRMLYEKLPIIIITGIDGDVPQKELTEMGERYRIDWIFRKPLSMTSVFTKIKSFLAMPAIR